MIFEVLIIFFFFIIIYLIYTRTKDYDIDLFIIKEKLDSMKSDMNSLDIKLNTILNELGYEVRPR